MTLLFRCIRTRKRRERRGDSPASLRMAFFFLLLNLHRHLHELLLRFLLIRHAVIVSALGQRRC
jgi:hypothetical protein